MAAIEAIEAEAQALWEEKATADAAAWAERVKRAEGEAMWAQIWADADEWHKPLEGEEEEEP